MTSVLGDRSFRRLWLAAFCSETAEWMLQVALPLFVYVETGSAASTAVTMVLGLAPAVLLGPPAGLLADRRDRRLVVCLACVGQALAAMPLLWAHATGALPLVYVVMAAQAGIAAMIEPARNALVPDLVGPDKVAVANGLLAVNSNLARLTGAWLGGVLLASGDLLWVFIGYLAAAVVAAGLLARPFGSQVRTRSGQPVSVRALLDGAAEFGRNPGLRIMALVLVFVSIAQGMFLVLFVLFVTDSLGGTESDVGMLRGVQAVGGLVAGIGLATLAGRTAPARLFGWGTLALGLLSAMIWNGPHVTTELAVYVGLFAMVGIPAVVSAAGLQSVLQTAGAPDVTGRVLATAFAGMAAGNAVGMLVAGALADVAGLWILLGVQAVLHVVAGLLALGGHRVGGRPLRRPCRGGSTVGRRRESRDRDGHQSLHRAPE